MFENRITHEGWDCKDDLKPFKYDDPKQRRIQDLSEGGVRFFSEQKNPNLGTKRREECEIFFYFPVLH